MLEQKTTTIESLSECELKNDVNGRECYFGKTSIVINDKSHSVSVKVWCEQDDLPPSEWIDDNEVASEVQKDEWRQKLESGNAMIGVCFVDVHCNGIEGTDSIGGSFVEKHQDFVDIVNDNALIDQALSDLRSNIEDTLKAFAKK